MLNAVGADAPLETARRARAARPEAALALEGMGAVERRPLLPDLIAKRLKDMIAGGELAPGQKLPSEAVLARQFGVARPTVREAKKALALAGLLDVHVGKGSYVRRSAPRRLDIERVFDQSRTSLIQIVEGRRILEGGIVVLAALRATPQDIQSMRVALERLEAAAEVGNTLGVFAADAAFHLALVRATHNEYLYRAYDGTRGLIQEMVASMSKEIAETKGFHEQLLAAIEAHDTYRARELLIELLEGSRKSIEAEFL